MMKNGVLRRLRQAEPPRGSAPSSTAAVWAHGLRVTRGGRQVLQGLDLEVSSGSITGLLGPSGCGKTTLMRVLVGVQRHQGQVMVLGRHPGDRALRGRVGYVTQGAAVYRDLTARQNLAYFAALAGDRAQDVDEALGLVGLTALADRRVETFSGGETGRVSLACALVASPDLLVLDEPTVGLDPLTREDLWAAFRALAQAGRTLLVSSHVMDEAFRCDSVLLMRAGKMLGQTTATELLEHTGARTIDDAFLALLRPDGEEDKEGQK